MDFFQFPSCSLLKNNFEEPSKFSFSFFHVNIRSIRKYWDHFMIIVQDLDTVIDAFILTEINATEDRITQFSIPGYNRFAYTRRSGRGGGICVYLRSSWLTTNIVLTMANAEHVGLEISCQDFSLIFIAIYRPPSSNANLFLEELSKTLAEFSPTGQLCLLGDFNINIMDSSRHVVCDYLNLLATHGIDSVIQAPTREEFLGGNFVSSCIDHINLRIFDSTVKAAVISEKLADHYYIACQVKPNIKGRGSSTTKREITIIDQAQFDKKVNDYDWDGLLTSVEAPSLYDTIVGLFSQFSSSRKKKSDH